MKKQHQAITKQTETQDLKALQVDNARLLAENARLKRIITKSGTKLAKSPRHLLRKLGVVVLLALSVALLTVGNLFFWTGNTIVKQDRFVAATQPIVKDPVVQNAMALYTANSIFNSVDVQSATESVLPPRADFLAPQLTNQLKSFTQATLQKVLANPSFQTKWNTALATQHDRLVSFASQYQGDGDISLNNIYQQLSASLGATKLSFLANKQLPPRVGDITVVNATWLPTFHKVVTHIDTWRFLAISLMVISLAAAMWLSAERRRTLYVFSLFSALMMATTLVALHLIKGRIVDSADPQYAAGVARVVQIVFHSLVTQTVTLMAAVLAVGAIAWVSSGPSANAAALKRQVALLFNGKLHEQIFAEDNEFTIWVSNHKNLVQWGIVAVLTLVMLIVHLTLMSLFIYLLLMVVLILAVNVIAGQATSVQKLDIPH
jgi:hypothetical protein